MDEEDDSNEKKDYNQEFQKKEKNKMLFVVQQVEYSRSLYSYNGSTAFEELLEFYCYLNALAVNNVSVQDDKSEKYYLSTD